MRYLLLILLLVFGCDITESTANEVDVDWIIIRESDMFNNSEDYGYEVPGYYFFYTSDSAVEIHTLTEVGWNFPSENTIVDSSYNLSFTYNNELFTYYLNVAEEIGFPVYQQDFHTRGYECQRVIINLDMNYATIFPLNSFDNIVNTASPNEIVDYR